MYKLPSTNHGDCWRPAWLHFPAISPLPNCADHELKISTEKSTLIIEHWPHAFKAKISIGDTNCIKITNSVSIIFNISSIYGQWFVVDMSQELNTADGRSELHNRCSQVIVQLVSSARLTIWKGHHERQQGSSRPPALRPSYLTYSCAPELHIPQECYTLVNASTHLHR